MPRCDFCKAHGTIPHALNCPQRPCDQCTYPGTTAPHSIKCDKQPLALLKEQEKAKRRVNRDMKKEEIVLQYLITHVKPDANQGVYGPSHKSQIQYLAPLAYEFAEAYLALLYDK